MSNDSLY